MAQLTEPQRRVLEWLMLYPELEIVISGAPFAEDPYPLGPDGFARFTAYWANPKARQNMNSIAGDVFGLPKVQPYIVDADGPTPHLTRRTFDALYGRGLLEKRRYWRGAKYVCSHHYYRPTEFASVALLECVGEGIRGGE